MLLLTSASDLIQVVTASAVTGMDVHASWVDVAGTTVTPGRTNTPQITSNVTTTVVAGPATGSQRNVKQLSIRNTHATSSNVITVQHYDGTTTTTLVKWTLLAGFTMTYNDGDGWVLIDTAGGRVLTPLAGRYLGSTVVSSASANFTTGAQTNKIFVRGVGGGGGGAGCTSVASATSAGGGGGAGGYAEKMFTVSPSTAYAYTCGALGAGSSGALGGTGLNSTFVVGGTTVTAFGGVGAPVATAATTLTTYPGGAGGAVSTNGDLNAGGMPGGNGTVVIIGSGTTEVLSSGAGGSSPFGGGGVGISTSSAGANGTAATGFGAGGGGATTGASQARAGGNGSAGCWVIDEYS